MSAILASPSGICRSSSILERASSSAGTGVGLHRLDFAHDDGRGLADVLRIAGVLHEIGAARAPDLQRRADGIDEPGVLAQIDAQPRRIEPAAEHGIAELQRVVVGIGAR